MAQSIRFSIDLPAEKILRYYQGTARHVLVKADDGRNVRLAAHHLRPFVDASGIHGRFELELDEHNKFLSVSRLA